MLTRIGIAVLGLLAVSACDKPQPSPLADMPAPTEARVRAARQAAEHAADRWAVRDTIVSTEGLDSLLTLVTTSGRWRVVDDEPPLATSALYCAGTTRSWAISGWATAGYSPSPTTAWTGSRDCERYLPRSSRPFIAGSGRHRAITKARARCNPTMLGADGHAVVGGRGSPAFNSGVHSTS